MDFVTAVKLYFSNYVNFQGRSSRPAYWWPVLMNFIVSLILSWIGGLFGSETGSEVLGGIWSLVNILPGLAVSVRRLHDIGKSWTWIFINLIPVIGVIWYIILMVKPSQPEPNEYGPVPMQ